MRKWIAVAVLACCAQVARGQCQPTNSPTLDFSNSTVQSPSQYAAQGHVTATLQAYASNVTGSALNHKMTVTPGTWIGFKYASNNGVSAVVYYTKNNDPTHLGETSFALNGDTGNNWLMGTSDVGVIWHRVFAVTDQYGNTTQDTFSISTVSGSAPSIVSQDTIPNNGYLIANLTYSGTPNIPYQTTCPNATEKDMVPTAQLQLANVTSGENRHGVSLAGATTVVGQPVYATVSDGISFIPGDVIVPSAGGFVYCSAIGDFWQEWTSISVEWAWTKAQTLPSTCHYVSGGGVRCNLTPHCSPISSPPDWIPHEITTNQFGLGDMPSFWLGGSVGFSIAESPYIFPGSIIAGILPGAVNWATFLAPGIPSTSTVIDCTNTPNNIHPIIPWPF